MRTASAIARYLAGVIFLVLSLNGFLSFIPLPPPGGIAGQFMGALYASHYLWVIFAFQVVAAILLLVNRYVSLAVADRLPPGCALARLLPSAITSCHNFSSRSARMTGALLGRLLSGLLSFMPSGTCSSTQIRYR